MKEININIEGYNVNGICVGCLNYNRKMFYVDEVRDCFKLIGNIDVPDGLTIQVCWECLAQVRTVNRFQQQILSAYEILIDYSNQHTFLNSPTDLSQYATKRFTCTSAVDDFDKVFNDEENVLKEEVIKNEGAFADEVVKLEPDFDDTNCSDEYLYETKTDIVLDKHEVENCSSDDDVQLSKLKKKKHKKERKKRGKKRKSEDIKQELVDEKADRKLKNLPPELVELYTMTEEEMWQIRNEDVSSKEFEKLRFKCSDCVKGFNTEKLMVDHMNGKHKSKGPDSVQCDICHCYFLAKDNIAAHRSLHSLGYRCVACGVRTGMKRLMVRHCAVHARAAACAQCGESFSSKSKLSYHRGVCQQEKPQCDCCGKVFANKVTLKYHLKILPQSKEGKPREKLYIQCKGCDKVFNSKKSYRSHVVIHDGITYPCPTCGKQFQWKRNLSRHCRAHRERAAGGRPECRECGKTFASRDCYNNHMRFSKKHVSQDMLMHTCNYCGKKFASKYCMVDHIDWDHLKRIKYQCSVCFKAFKTSKIMVAHMNHIHEGKRLKDPDGHHLCDICGKSYKTDKRLKGHVWAMHTKRSTTKSFKCKLCPATFTWQTSIYKHMKMMHDNKRAKLPRAPSKPAAPPPGGPPPGAQLAGLQYFQPGALVQLHPGIVNNIVQG